MSDNVVHFDFRRRGGVEKDSTDDRADGADATGDEASAESHLHDAAAAYGTEIEAVGLPDPAAALKAMQGIEAILTTAEVNSVEYKNHIQDFRREGMTLDQALQIMVKNRDRWQVNPTYFKALRDYAMNLRIQL